MHPLAGRAVVVALRLATPLAGAVPRRAAEPLCRLAGLAWWAAAPASREAVRCNLRQILGREPRPGQVREVFAQGALNYWDTLALAHLGPEDLVALVPSRGWEHLDAALAQGKGAIMAGMHLSSVALTAQTVAARGYPVTSVVEPIQPPELFEALTHLRSISGMTLLPAGPSAVRDLLRALRRNEVVGLITDRDVLGTGPKVTFFGAPTTFPDGPAALSLRTGAPILVAAALRRPDGRFEGQVDPPIAFTPSGNPRADVVALTQALANRLEYHIGARPEQWTVFQKRWPATAPGEGSRPGPTRAGSQV